MKKNKANIYAFQEYKRGQCCITYTEIESKREHCGNNECKMTSEHAEKIWNSTFPWIDFKGGYWDEQDVSVAGRTIKIINFHRSLSYHAELQYVLLKRLKEICEDENALVILLGDFNAAFNHQTDKPITENHKYLTLIEECGFEECLCSDEKDKRKPHYTYYYYDNKQVLKRKKLDHIFVSKSLSNWLYTVEYIDNVNVILYPKSEYAFTDHSGIKLTITLPAPEEICSL